MNIENIQKAIAIMERAKDRDSVNMEYWQSTAKAPGYPVKRGSAKISEMEFHACGNKACFAGHIAVSPEFQDDGGTVDIDGSPALLGSIDEEAIADWFGISTECSRHFVYGGTDHADSSIYGDTPWDEVNADDVIQALRLLLDKGEKECLKLWPKPPRLSE